MDSVCISIEKVFHATLFAVDLFLDFQDDVQQKNPMLRRMISFSFEERIEIVASIVFGLTLVMYSIITTIFNGCNFVKTTASSSLMSVCNLIAKHMCVKISKINNQHRRSDKNSNDKASKRAS